MCSPPCQRRSIASSTSARPASTAPLTASGSTSRRRPIRSATAEERRSPPSRFWPTHPLGAPQRDPAPGRHLRSRPRAAPRQAPRRRAAARARDGWLNLIHVDDAARIVVAADQWLAARNQSTPTGDGPHVFCVTDGALCAAATTTPRRRGCSAPRRRVSSTRRRFARRRPRRSQSPRSQRQVASDVRS